MTIEAGMEVRGLARLDAAQRGIAIGKQLQPLPIPEVVRETVPTHPTNRKRRELKLTWEGLKALAQQEQSQ